MQYSDQDCIDALQEALKRFGHPPEIGEYKKSNLSPSASTVARKLGNRSWDAALRSAGLDPEEKKSRLQYSEEDCVRSLRQAANTLGESPSGPQYIELGLLPGIDTIKRVCGGWNEGKRKAGLEKWIGRRKRLSVNDDYFSAVDTLEKAYWFGFLFADGHVNKEKSQIQLQLQQTDRPHIESFVEAVGSEYAIRDFVVPDTDREKSSTTILSQQMTEDLLDLGCVPHRGNTDFLPDLSESLFVSFLRGLFDGDGSAVLFTPDHTKSEQGRWGLTSGSKQRLERINQWFDARGVSGGNVYELPDDSGWGTGSQLHINRRSDIRRVWDLLYPDGIYTSPSMMRKTYRIYRAAR